MILSTALLIALPASVEDTLADFTLNWQRDYAAEGASFVNNDAYVVCNMSYIAGANCGGGWGGGFDLSGSHDDGTAFLQEQLNLGGQLYYHVIVGDYTRDSMVQEVFIKSNSANPDYYNGWGSDIRASDTLGNTGNRLYNMTQPYSSDSSLAGTGSANPNSVIMRQIINSSEISMGFLKDPFTQKPLITQTVTTPEIVSAVSIDMRGRNYSQLTPIGAADMTNTVVLLGADRQGTEGDFDMSAYASSANITAGGFTYTPGAGYGGSGGAYTWFNPSDSFQPMNRDYQVFCDPAQNPNWGNGPCLGGGGGGGGGGW